jgi:hypothetical protein
MATHPGEKSIGKRMFWITPWETRRQRRHRYEGKHGLAYHGLNRRALRPCGPENPGLCYADFGHEVLAHHALERAGRGGVEFLGHAAGEIRLAAGDDGVLDPVRQSHLPRQARGAESRDGPAGGEVTTGPLRLRTHSLRIGGLMVVPSPFNLTIL